MATEEVLSEVQGRVGIITLNRPERLNTLTPAMREALRDRVAGWNDDTSVGAIVLTGSGRGFCSGADIQGFEEATREVPRHGDGDASQEWFELVRESKPIVCAINGVAVGEGITMTLPCDVRVASEDARISFRFVRLGLTPEYGSTHYLSHLVGMGHALELMLTGAFLKADEALRIGLVNHVYPPAQHLVRAIELAQEIAEGPTWHLSRVKDMVHAHCCESDIHKVASAEGEFFRQAMATWEHREALAAFRERRAPRFH